MSVQLAVFPQVGINTSNLANQNYQYLVDCFNWNTLNTSTSNTIAGSPTFVQDQINYYHGVGININTFYRGFSTGVQVTEVANAAVFQVGHSCIIQKITGVFPGVNYQFNGTVDLYTPAASNVFKLLEFDGNVLKATHVISNLTAYQTNTGGSFIFNFTNIQFHSTNPTLVLHYHTFGGSASAFVLNRCFLNRMVNQPPTFNALFNNGEVILDLYEDEDIPLTLSIDDFTKVAEKVQSYSKSFQIPQTKRNKQTFNDIFEITRFYDGVVFNPYMKTECTLRVDGILIFQGFLRLIDINDKGGEVSYNINLYSESIALKDVLESRIIGDIDFSELDHEYHYDNIQDSIGSNGLTLDNNLPAGTYAGTAGSNRTLVLKYPFCDWKHKYTFDSVGNPILNRLEDAFRPWINIRYIINKIFEQTPFRWKSDFFDSADFGKLFMDFNWGDDGMPVSNGTTSSNLVATELVGPTSAITTSFQTYVYENYVAFIGPASLNAFTGLYTSPSNNTEMIVTGTLYFDNTSGSARTITLQLSGDQAGVPTVYSTLTFVIGTGTTSHPITFPPLNLNLGDTFIMEVKADATGVNVIPGTSFTALSVINYDETITNVVNSAIINTNRGELGQWEFLSGILKMFNMVSLPTDIPNEIQFEPYADVFIKTGTGTSLADRSVTHDWTYKMDTQDIKLKPLTNLNVDTIFKFEEDDDDYAFNAYKNATRHLYGSKKFDASGATLLTGSKEISAKPFAATVMKRLENNLDEFVVPTIYAFDESSGSESFENAPRILYDTGRLTLLNNHFTVPAQNGVAGGDKTQYRQFSHTDVVPAISSDYDFVFGEQFLFSGMGTAPLNNLFNLYWLPYFNELYNPDTRTLTVKLNLSASDINTFKFNDLVFVKQRIFRVNRIDYKPNDLSTVEFILIP
ncbi:MAG: hypothetical protein Unbinned3904contig1002_40 [Prokaryotic dsDNA virus sp.]|nr:MAG: hypothetical protein Unbinned3904contig1002_40 [Prokaryotic dsDNA virus sp.]|tara:strand:+ start:5964 stop:8699 length:2736 start_codon:yes stop_codon:yes gene_type:complete